MKNHFSKCVVAMAMLLTGAQAYAQDVKTDYDRTFNLQSLKTFNFLPQERAADDPLKAIPFVQQRIQDGLTEALAKRGIQKSDNPDFVIALYAKLENESQWNVSGYGGWGAGWRYGGGMGTIDQQTYTVGTVVVDFVSTKTKNAVWHGSATRTVDPEKSEKNIRKGSEKMINEFSKDVAKQQKSKSKS
jgi:Domain of unknown function (DUF4136)